MANPIILYGRSGMGKSYSLRNLPLDEYSLISVLGKRLPFRGKPATVQTFDYELIKSLVARSTANMIVIDDAGFLITDMFMRLHSTMGSGASIFEIYNLIADSFYFMMRFFCDLPQDDKNIYVIMHEDFDEQGNSKLKTVGKLLDEKVDIQSLVTVVLHAVYRDGDYLFDLNGPGIWKTPPEVFGMGVDEMPNDLLAVDDRLREMWEQNPRTKVGPR